jgi:hypothetical protein
MAKAQNSETNIPFMRSPARIAQSNSARSASVAVFIRQERKPTSREARRSAGATRRFKRRRWPSRPCGRHGVGADAKGCGGRDDKEHRQAEIHWAPAGCRDVQAEPDEGRRNRRAPAQMARADVGRPHHLGWSASRIVATLLLVVGTTAVIASRQLFEERHSGMVRQRQALSKFRVRCLMKELKVPAVSSRPVFSVVQTISQSQ